MANRKELKISFSEFDTSELKSSDATLLQAAIEAMQSAHAPYSGFKVGSAVLLENGEVVTGNNQENAAYPSGLCAERVALFTARSQSKTPISSIAVVAINHALNVADAFCCGACRQVIIEYASMQSEPIRVLMRSANEKIIVIDDAKELLPFHFYSESLQ